MNLEYIRFRMNAFAWLLKASYAEDINAAAVYIPTPNPAWVASGIV